MTPVGDIEFEIVFRIVVRGRTRDLAQLLEAMRKAGAVVMWVVEGLPNRKSKVRRILRSPQEVLPNESRNQERDFRGAFNSDTPVLCCLGMVEIIRLPLGSQAVGSLLRP